MLKDPSTYESISPQPLGRDHEFVLGKHSGTGLVDLLLAKNGIATTPELSRRILDRIKATKVATNKAPLRVMATRLTELWARHLAFSDEELWRIVYEELSRTFGRPKPRPAALASGTRPPGVRARTRNRAAL
jgi:isopropylmalate/homocitrate/citramalate synthase